MKSLTDKNLSVTIVFSLLFTLIDLLPPYATVVGFDLLNSVKQG